MKTDVLLIPMGARYANMRAAAIAAENAGFDGLWMWDHLRDPQGGSAAGVPEAWTTLTALAEATRRVALGPLVLNVSNRHPGLLANMAATLQPVSGGRLLLGHGDGFNTQAFHPQLADLVRVARAEHEAAGRDPSTFIVTVFAGLQERWLRAESRARSSLEALGVARLILLVEPPFDPRQVESAGTLLGAERRQ